MGLASHYDNLTSEMPIDDLRSIPFNEPHAHYRRASYCFSPLYLPSSVLDIRLDTTLLGSMYMGPPSI
jgi:hypothetical protein